MVRPALPKDSRDYISPCVAYQSSNSPPVSLLSPLQLLDIHGPTLQWTSSLVFLHPQVAH